MRIILIVMTVLLFNRCTSKNKTELKSSIDSGSVMVDTSILDDGFSELSKESKNIVYDSISLMNCIHENLFSKFNIHVHVVKHIDTVQGHVSSTVKLLLFDKINNILFDTIQLNSEFYFGSIFDDCKNVMSYATRFNIGKQVADNDYGDIVVADFNFDDREDIALINDMGGNAGPLYSFFIQNKDQKFIKDTFLTDSMEFFPSEINKNKKKLTTYIHAGVCGLGEHIYTFDSNKNCWKEESHKIIDICK